MNRQQMAESSWFCLKEHVRATELIYCHPDIVSKIGVTFTLLDNEIRMKQTVTQSPEFGQKSDSHLEGYYQQLQWGLSCLCACPAVSADE